MSIVIEGQTALVTGANRGIGKAITESLLARGAQKVYLAVRNPESANELIQSHGERVVTLKVDVTDEASVQEAARQASDVTIVVNNAGILEVADPLDAQAQSALERELDVNVFGLIRVAQAFIPVLESNGGGAFVQLNSIASIKNFSGFSTYSASKAASYSLTQGLRDSVADKGIAVVSVHPGPIATDMAAKAGFDPELSDSVESVAESLMSAIENEDFLLFPDVMAKQFEQAYAGYAQALILGGE